MKSVASIFSVGCLVLSVCASTFAVADAVGSTAVYAGKTVVNTIDVITPDIVNKDSK